MKPRIPGRRGSCNINSNPNNYPSCVLLGHSKSVPKRTLYGNPFEQSLLCLSGSPKTSIVSQKTVDSMQNLFDDLLDC
ncbi:hypothetical protein PanWU01x14_212960 [Parasponia andersonii]|uniref:Uncharacterized protein n=1 Tax=Parasponia andersonii TaxID=3476 RepID=A0A2P5BSW5_PARAD|nr:hypothetical protein PanWU01x14_212960 [Parasponia andersonii]